MSELSRVDGRDLMSLVNEQVAGSEPDLGLVEAASVELIRRIIRADMMIGILPVEAEDVVAVGLTAAGRGGSTTAWLELGRHQLREGDAGAALASFGQAVDDPRGALEFAKAARWGSTDDQVRAREVLTPFVQDDPDGTLTYQLGLVHYWLDDFAASLECHKRAAAKGNADALFELYVLYGNGDGVEADPDAAHEWLVKAADKGQFRALYNVAAGYATGNGFPKDPARAIEYYERSAGAGNARAAATLGVMCLTGEGLEADPKRAARWFDEAEELGFDVDEWLDAIGVDRPATD
jgi:TPR repeat protein